MLIDLGAPGDLDIGQMPVVEAIRRRRSRREFTEEPLSLGELSFLLWATQGIDQEATRAFGGWLATKDPAVAKARAILRTVPSAGGRHPFETYLLVHHVEGLAPGLYRYLALEHKLVALRVGGELAEQVADAFMLWVQRSAVVFIWATVPYRTEWRYSIVAHKMIAQESGHVCQNLYLASEAIGAGACAITYDQAKVDGILGVDGEEEFTIYVAPVGKVTAAKYHFDH
ncbi:MAG: SagB/ThcOx family dehydrogenase [Anaerolineae bacterium]|jgi:SagB-type dehydrogenase family enzyme